ncbi:MAG: glycosyltransferase family 39 protein [Steroidobacteraceae bacterium]
MSLRTEHAAVNEPADPLPGPLPWQWLIGITALAALLRAIALNSDLWVDEVFSLLASIRRPIIDSFVSFTGDTQHPLYMPLAQLSVAIFGESPASIRLPAMLFGVASVPMLYRLGTAVTTRREAAIAASLLALSYHHIWFSQSARGYTMLAFWLLLSTWLLLRLVRRPTVLLLLAFAASSACGVFTHATMVFAILGQALVLGVYLLAVAADRRAINWPWTIAAFALAGAFTLLLYAPMLDQVISFFLHRRSPLVGVSTPHWALGEAYRVLQAGLGALGPAAGPAVLMALLVLMTGFISFVRRNALATALFTVPVLVTFAGALLARGTMYPRFFFFLAGFFVLLLVRGTLVIAMAVAAWLKWRWLRPSLAAYLAAGLMLAVSAASLVPLYRYPKQDFSGAMQFVDSVSRDQDRVVAVGTAARVYREYFGRNWPAAASDAELQGLRASGQRVWVVYTLAMYIAAEDPQLMRVLNEDCRQRQRFRGTLGGGDLYVCVLEPRNPASEG